MADALTYQLKLIDAMSGPAKQADSAIAALASELKRASELAKTLGKEEAAAAKIIVKEQIAAEKAVAKAQKQADQAAVKEQQKADKLILAQARKTSTEYKSIQQESGGALDFIKDKLAIVIDPMELAGKAASFLASSFETLFIGSAKLAIDAAEAKQDTLDLLDAMLGSQAAAKDVYSRIEKLTGDVAISQERATGLARELSAAGVTSADALTNAIKTIGQVESVLGGEAGSKIQNIIEKATQSGKFTLSAKQLVGTGVQVQKLFEQIAKNTGKGVKQVEAELKAGKISAEVGVAALNQVVSEKFAGPAKGQVLDLGNQMQRFKDNVSKLFEDVDTGPFLDSLHDILQLFDQSTPAGQALKQTLTTIFDGVFKAASVALPYVKAGLKGIVIIGLQVAIALKPLIKTIKDAFGGDSKSGVDSFASALSSVGEAIGTVVGWVVKLATNQTVIDGFKTAFYGVAVVVGILAAGVGLLLAPFYALGAAIIYVIGLGEQFVQWALNVGGQVVNGLIQGILGGGAALGSAVAKVAHGAIGGFADIFKIHSPSKVMAGMGKNLMSGLSMGIDFGAPAANDTLAAAVEPAPMLGKAASGGSTTNHSVGNVTIEITINGVGSVSELKEAMPAIMADALEQAGLTVGAPQAA